jgi:membrane fusion protein, adhesin transport system
MAVHFSQTLAALANDRPRHVHIVWAAATVGIVAWSVWFFTAPLTLYATSQTAHAEARDSAHAVDVPMAGQLLSLTVTLGRAVEAGDIIAELDATEDRLRLAQAQATLSGLQSEFDHLGRQIEARQSQQRSEASAAEAAAAVAETHNDEVIAALEFARGRAERLGKLAKAGGTPTAEALKAAADLDALVATQKGWVSEVLRIRLEAHASDARTAAEIEGLTNDRVALTAAVDTARATITLTEREVARHSIRAPISGHIGDLGTARPGAFVAVGERLATVVPDGLVIIAADFAPSEALGRIHAGQLATFKLDGNGLHDIETVPATVSAVASEVRDNLVRVELAVDPDAPGATALQHGQPGSLEIAVEESTPASLVWRVTGLFARSSK